MQLKGNKLASAVIPPHRLFEVEKGHCWIEGDNANNSIDSYRFGQVAGVWLVDG